MNIDRQKESTNEIQKNFVCSNCGRLIVDEVQIYPFSKICNECSTLLDSIGIVTFGIIVPVLIVLLVWFVHR
jgi:thymidine kinase